MMTEISLNILDIAENSVRAGADLVEISIRVSTEKDKLCVEIKDNGCGMTKDQLDHVEDPFYTTRTTRKVGLGVPFFKMAAICSGGSFRIDSEPGKGTDVYAEFGFSNIDRMPLGDIDSTIYTLIVYHQDIDFCYTYQYDQNQFVLDTRELKGILGDISFSESEVSEYIKAYLSENKKEADGGAIY